MFSLSPRPLVIWPRFGPMMAGGCFSPKDAVSSVKASRIRGRGSVLGIAGPKIVRLVARRAIPSLRDLQSGNQAGPLGSPSDT
jgi:hypothetical protein